MEIRTSDTPAAAAGIHLSDSIHSADRAVICLLSGGSAFSVIPYIQLSPDAKVRTIFMLGDERVSRGEENNFLQLQVKYPGFVHEHTVLDTSAQDSETAEAFATRIEKKFLKYFQAYEHVHVVALVGIGEDGHTAGIFPLPPEAFAKTYPDDQTYVPVHVESLRIDSRASFTPQWLQTHVDELIGYVVGESKKTTLESLKNESKPIYEMPAQLIKEHTNATIYTDQIIS